MNPDTKAQVLEAIKQAEQQAIATQDKYRAIIRQIQAKPATPAQVRFIKSLTLEEIDEIMRGQAYPPTPDTLTLLNISSPQEDRIAGVEDTEIRCALTILSQTADHTQRIKVLAKFLSAVGAYSPKIYGVFGAWADTLVLRGAMQGAAPAPTPV